MQTGKTKIKQRQMSFLMHISTIFGKAISRHGVRPDPRKLKTLAEMLPPKQKMILKHSMK